MLLVFSLLAVATEMHGWSSALAILARYGFPMKAKVAELVDALALGASGVTRESSSLSFRTSTNPVAAVCRPIN